MKTMFILMSHPLTPQQEEDARRRFGVERFEKVESAAWSQIPASADSVLPYLGDLLERLENEAKEGDLLFVQGDFGATCAMVQWAFKKRLTPVYATTEREAVERVEGDRVVTTRVFRHIRFREYERIV